MPVPYSEDLRRKIIQACERGTESQCKVTGIETAIAAATATLIYLPPYSPDWSPIEPCWSAIKTRLRGMKARTREALDRALTKIINTISNRDA
jgi:transposase